MYFPGIDARVEPTPPEAVPANMPVPRETETIFVVETDKDVCGYTVNTFVIWNTQPAFAAEAISS